MTTLVIEHVKAGELPPQWVQRLQVRPEQTVTVRIETETPTTAPAETSTFVTDDPAFGIAWPMPVSVISDKDAAWAPFEASEVAR